MFAGFTVQNGIAGVHSHVACRIVDKRRSIRWRRCLGRGRQPAHCPLRHPREPSAGRRPLKPPVATDDGASSPGSERTKRPAAPDPFVSQAALPATCATTSASPGGTAPHTSSTLPRSSSNDSRCPSPRSRSHQSPSAPSPPRNAKIRSRASPRDSSRSRKHAWHGVQAAELALRRRLSGANAKRLIRAQFERNRSDERPEKQKGEVSASSQGRGRRTGGTLNSISDLAKDENPV